LDRLQHSRRCQRLPAGARPDGKQLPPGPSRPYRLRTADYGGAWSARRRSAHRYVFTIHALKVESSTCRRPVAALVGFMLHGTEIARTSLTPTTCGGPAPAGEAIPSGLEEELADFGEEAFGSGAVGLALAGRLELAQQLLLALGQVDRAFRPEST